MVRKKQEMQETAVPVYERLEDIPVRLGARNEVVEEVVVKIPIGKYFRKRDVVNVLYHKNPTVNKKILSAQVWSFLKSDKRFEKNAVPGVYKRIA